MLNTSIKPSLNKIRTLIETQPEIATNLDKHNLRTPLMVAASFGYNDVMGLLLEHGASANAVDIDGKTALYYAADSSEINSINFLLDNGADPLVGQSILHSIALDDMNDDINNLIDRLIHMGLDINLMDDEGDTAVHIAVINKKYGIVEKLVNSGANCMLANYDGIIPLMSAIKLPNYALFKLLLPKTDLGDRNLRINLYILAIDKHFEQMAIDLLKTGAYDEIDIGYIKNKVRR